MRLEQHNKLWVFTGRVPMELAGKGWKDRYHAVTAANRSGYDCFANGHVAEMACNDPDAECNRSSSDDFDHDAEAQP